MAFGSEQLFDAHFNIAHGLKNISYFIVFLAIVIDSPYTMRQTLDIETHPSSPLPDVDSQPQT